MCHKEDLNQHFQKEKFHLKKTSFKKLNFKKEVIKIPIEKELKILITTKI